ncbi:Ig-like domain-containing protein [uncultured Prevotella sp.]|uniref:Ig-like domain-containing protein n=1 Tax=uncultured Prevotella sp. TaxID=159272 RepID=UPI0027E2BB16|nr:Ig-like domain-containing protein [uncultured Prevotella sp.]
MIKTLRFTLMAVMMLICGAISAQEVTLDFTDNSKWKLPEGSSKKLKESKEFSNGTYTVVLTAASSGYYFNSDGYLMLGKKDATLTLPKFNFAVSKIEVIGHAGASASVLQNIFVGNVAVSTETKGAALDTGNPQSTGDAKTNTYEINAAYQAAGNQYTLKVTSKHNTQITKILIYKQSGAVKENPALAFSVDKVNHEVGTDFTAPTFSKKTTATVKFSSDNEAVATVNAEGVIALGTEEGKAVITAEAAENDKYAAGKATCTIYVWHYVTYKKATEIVSGEKYLIVAQRDGNTYYAMPQKETANFGYLNTQMKEGTLDELKIESSYDDNFVFAEFEDGYSIQDCYGRYLYMDGEHASFQLGKEPVAWELEASDNGTFSLTNNGKFIQFGDGTYTTFGAYAKKMDKTVLPMLFKMVEGATGINNIQTTTAVKNNVMYNIAGQRVNKDYKGLVIMNGKKMMVK